MGLAKCSVCGGHSTTTEINGRFYCDACVPLCGDSLVKAYEQGKISVDQLKTQNKIDVNGTSKSGRTLLMEAANKGDTAMATFLLENGAEVNVTSNYGWTPLLEAAIKGHTQIVKLLVDHKAEVNAQQLAGYSALSLAAAHGHKEIAEILLNNGADVNIKDKAGMTALDRAPSGGNREIIDMLLKHKAKQGAAEPIDLDPNHVQKVPDRMAETRSKRDWMTILFGTITIMLLISTVLLVVLCYALGRYVWLAVTVVLFLVTVITILVFSGERETESADSVDATGYAKFVGAIWIIVLLLLWPNIGLYMDSGSIAQIAANYKSTNDVVRLESVQKLARLTNKTTVTDRRISDVMIAALQDKNLEIRSEAIDVLDSLQERRALDALARVARKDPSVGLRRKAGEVARRIKPPVKVVTAVKVNQQNYAALGYFIGKIVVVIVVVYFLLSKLGLLLGGFVSGLWLAYMYTQHIAKDIQMLW